MDGVREYADGHDLILLSGSSTAPSLSLAGDTTFRLIPDDSYLAVGVGRFLDREGTSVVVPLARNDVWGDDWMTLLREEIEARGGTVAEPVRYDPDTTDFGPVLDELVARVDEAAETHGSGEGAVYTITLDEIATILHQAALYPGLSRVRWYGSDLAGLQEYSGTAIDFAVEVNFTYPMYGDAAGWRAVPTLEEIGERIDRTPDPLALNDYDALWLATYTRLISDSEDADVYRWLIPQFGENYRGVTGRLTIGDTGDRTFCVYTFQTMTRDGWEPVLGWISDPEHGELWRLYEDGEPAGSLTAVEADAPTSTATPAAPLVFAPVLALIAVLVLGRTW